MGFIHATFRLFAVTLLTLSTLSLAAPASNTTNLRSFQDRSGIHHNSGLVNAAGNPFSLEYANPEKNIINAFGKDYAFTDLFLLTDFTQQAETPASLSIPDIEYFEFTEENLEDSQHSLFYALWSILAQEKPEFKKYGEWGLFAAEFMGTRNSQCGGDDSHCKEKTSLAELMAMYPGNRPLVRLVHFTGLKMSLLHDLHGGIEQHMHRTHTNLIGRIPSLIKSFTHQPDLGKLALCKLAHMAVEKSAAIGLDLAMRAAKLIPTGNTNVEIAFEPSLWFQVWPRRIHLKEKDYFGDWRQWEKGGFNKWWDSLDEEEKKVQPWPEDGKKPFVFAFDPKEILIRKFPDWATKAFRVSKAKFTHDLSLDQGYTNGILCGAWEGDDVDRSGANIQRLGEHMSTYFETLERATRDMYRELIEGRVLVPGQPTLMSLYGMNLKWAGKGSVLETLRNMEPLKTAISTDLEKRIISTTSRTDGNFQTCTHHLDAPSLCETARFARAGLLRGAARISDAMKSLVCVTPSTDPTLICQGSRWYWNAHFPHVIPFAGLNKFETYHGGRLNLTYEKAVREAYANYKFFGNEMGDKVESWNLGHVEGSGLRMPFCESEYLDIKDFSNAAPHLREEKQWQFPGVCGDVGVQTESFLESIKTGYGSQNWWAAGAGGKSLLLYHDRLPRLYNTLTPYLSYISYGYAGIQFPLRDPAPNWWEKTINAIKMKPAPLHKWWQVTTGRDTDFAKIREATKGMTEREGNIWFCRNANRKERHTVFQRERGHADILGIPGRKILSHGKKCEVWLREHM